MWCGEEARHGYGLFAVSPARCARPPRAIRQRPLQRRRF